MSERRMSRRTSTMPFEPKDGQGVVVQTGHQSDDSESHSTRGRPSIMNFRRMSRRSSILAFSRPILRIKPKLENTYRMEAVTGQRFNAPRVEEMLESVLDSHLDEKVYDPKTATSLAANIADVAKHRAKLMGFERHKIVTHVVIGNAISQGVEISSRCLWDSKNDDFASSYYKNGSLFAVATVYGMFLE